METNMKTRRKIIIIELFLTVIGILGYLLFKVESRISQISLAIFGSSLVSFLIEIQNYISE